MIPITPLTAIFPPLAFKVKASVSDPSELIVELKSILPSLALVSIVISPVNTAAPSISTRLPVVLEVVIFPPSFTAVEPTNLTDLTSSPLPIIPALIVPPVISITSSCTAPIVVRVTSPLPASIVK